MSKGADIVEGDIIQRQCRGRRDWPSGQEAAEEDKGKVESMGAYVSLPPDRMASTSAGGWGRCVSATERDEE